MQPGQLYSPFGIANDTKGGRLIICDYYNHRIQIFRETGEYLHQFGSFGNENGKFLYPLSVTIFDDKIYCTDNNTGRIQVFTKSGLFLTKFGGYGIDKGFFSFFKFFDF